MKDTLKNKIIATVSMYQDDILQFTQKLVTIATENPPGVFYKPCVDAIQNKLIELGLDCEIIKVPTPELGNGSKKSPRYCILSYYGTGERTLYFHNLALPALGAYLIALNTFSIRSLGTFFCL